MEGKTHKQSKKTVRKIKYNPEVRRKAAQQENKKCSSRAKASVAAIKEEDVLTSPSVTPRRSARLRDFAKKTFT